MFSKGYTLLPTEEHDFKENILTFDYGEKPEDMYKKYQSMFTYNKYPSSRNDNDEVVQNKSTDRMLANMCHYTLVICSYLILIATFPLTIWCCIKKIAAHERVVVFRLGRLQPVKEPGTTCLLPWIDSWKVVNILIRGFIIPPQQLILRDGSIVVVGGEIRFKVENVVKTVTQVEDLDNSIRLLGQTLLADLLQQITLSELLADKYAISTNLHDRLKIIVMPWGIKIVQIELTHPKVLQASSSKSNNCSALGTFMSSLQVMLQKRPSNTTSQPSKHQNDSINSLMIETILPTLTNSGAIYGQNGGIYKLIVEGDQGGVYWLDTLKGRTAAGELQKDMEPPDVTVTVSDADFLAIINSKLTPLQAYIGGKIRVAGDVKLLYSLQSILKTFQSTISSVEQSTNHSLSDIRII